MIAVDTWPMLLMFQRWLLGRRWLAVILAEAGSSTSSLRIYIQFSILAHEAITISWGLYVLHAFQKKTQTMAKRDIDLAKKRFTELMRGAR